METYLAFEPVTTADLSQYVNKSVGGVVTYGRLMQSRAWAARVNGARGARCAPLTAPVACSWRSLSTCNTTAAIALFLLTRLEHLVVIARVSLALSFYFETRFVSAGSLALLSSVPTFCSRFCSASLSSLPRLRLSRLSRATVTKGFTLTSQLVVIFDMPRESRRINANEFFEWIVIA